MRLPRMALTAALVLGLVAPGGTAATAAPGPDPDPGQGHGLLGQAPTQ